MHAILKTQRKEVGKTTRKSVDVTLPDEEREMLERRATSTDEWTSQRAKMILYAAKGMSNKTIAEKLGVSERVVSKWRKRFAENRLEGLNDSDRSGRKVALKESDLMTLLETVNKDMKEGYLPLRTLQQKLSNEHQIDVSIATLQRTLAKLNLPEGEFENFLNSSEAEFEPKQIEVIGLCISPPHHALFIRRKELQTANYSHAVLEPMKTIEESILPQPNDPQSLLIAFMFRKSLETNPPPKKSNQQGEEEFLKFLEDLQKYYPGEELHMIYLDTRKRNDEVSKWLYYHADFKKLSMESPDSWMSVVEFQLNLLTRVVIQKGMFKMDSGKVHLTSRDIISKIMDYIKEYSEDGKHFGWKIMSRVNLREYL